MNHLFRILLLVSILGRWDLLSAAPPNMVFFLADDLGQRAFGCYGSTCYETPNLD
jgi:hypothetical protein